MAARIRDGIAGAVNPGRSRLAIHAWERDRTYDATAGDLVLTGSFLGQEPGTIEGAATDNLMATGTFRAGAGGRIALSAGGTVDANAATFDQTVGTSCP